MAAIVGRSTTPGRRRRISPRTWRTSIAGSAPAQATGSSGGRPSSPPVIRSSPIRGCSTSPGTSTRPRRGFSFPASGSRSRGRSRSISFRARSNLRPPRAPAHRRCNRAHAIDQPQGIVLQSLDRFDPRARPRPHGREPPPFSAQPRSFRRPRRGPVLCRRLRRHRLPSLPRLLRGRATGTDWVFRDESGHTDFAFEVIATCGAEEPA